MIPKSAIPMFTGLEVRLRTEIEMLRALLARIADLSQEHTEEVHGLTYGQALGRIHQLARHPELDNPAPDAQGSA